jgi:hypothetical protein
MMLRENFVMAGLDPAISGAFKDPRVKPGDDEKEAAILFILLVAA